MPLPSPTQRRRRSGFTMIELLMVVVIIGILVALLIPAIQGVIRTAKAAAVSAEINVLASSLETFKTTYGSYPPSRIVLIENGDYSTKPSNNSANFNYTDSLSTVTADTTNGWLGSAALNYPTTGTDISYGTLLDRSTSNLRKFFPRVRLQSTTSSGGVVSVPGGFYDFNGNNLPDTKPILLQGHECLVFFLGGVPSYANFDPSSRTFTPVGMSGFTKNPLNPFINDSPSSTAGANRSAPLFEFKGNRFLDDDQDGMPGYIDSLAKPSPQETPYYAYFSAYGSNGYDPNDVNAAAETASLFTFRVNYASVNAVSGAPNPYTTSLAVPASGPTAYEKPQSYQIISPGHDRIYGYGGQFTGSGNGTHLPPFTGIDRTAEHDNLTNFTNGPLD